MVHLDLVLEAVVELKVVVLQGGAAAGAQPRVGARTVEQKPCTRGPQEDSQGAHGDNGDEDGIQGVEPALFFVGRRGPRPRGGGRRVAPVHLVLICDIKHTRLRALPLSR